MQDTLKARHIILAFVAMALIMVMAKPGHRAEQGPKNIRIDRSL